MLTAAQNVQRMDWSGWLRGIIGAIVSGGTAAISSGTAVSLLDKAKDLNVLHVMGISFVTSAIVSLAKFLQTQPIPPLVPPAPPSSTVQ